MNIVLSKSFEKQYQKLNPKLKLKTKSRLMLFCQDPTSRALRVHGLSGQHHGRYSIDINGDYRAIAIPKQNDAFAVMLNV
jgi:mRNA-degrading endonuclease YafQ of YafQ-DinJ toxin-antitoxin module